MCLKAPFPYFGGKSRAADLVWPRFGADTAKRSPDLYRCDSASVAHAVREWCLEWGVHPDMRIALCGYEGEHRMPKSWTCIQGKATNCGYGAQKRSSGGHSINGHRERIWFSPHCLRVKAMAIW